MDALIPRVTFVDLQRYPRAECYLRALRHPRAASRLAGARMALPWAGVGSSLRDGNMGVIALGGANDPECSQGGVKDPKCYRSE